MLENTPPNLYGLYVITHVRADETPSRHETIARAALRGGARLLQLRDKNHRNDELLEVGRRIAQLCRQHDAIFFINDRVQLAKNCGAHGVHLGPDDMTPEAARRVLGDDCLIGVSCGTVEEAQQAAQQKADYMGVGAVFSTATKADAGAPIGLENLREIVRSTSLPVAAIGGVDATNIAPCIAAGAAMACVVSAVCSAGSEDGMREATRNLVALIEKASASKC